MLFQSASNYTPNSVSGSGRQRIDGYWVWRKGSRKLRFADEGEKIRYQARKVPSLECFLFNASQLHAEQHQRQWAAEDPWPPGMEGTLGKTKTRG